MKKLLSVLSRAWARLFAVKPAPTVPKVYPKPTAFKVPPEIVEAYLKATKIVPITSLPPESMPYDYSLRQMLDRMPEHYKPPADKPEPGVSIGPV